MPGVHFIPGWLFISGGHRRGLLKLDGFFGAVERNTKSSNDFQKLPCSSDHVPRSGFTEIGVWAPVMLSVVFSLLARMHLGHFAVFVLGAGRFVLPLFFFFFFFLFFLFFLFFFFFLFLLFWGERGCVWGRGGFCRCFSPAAKSFGSLPR